MSIPRVKVKHVAGSGRYGLNFPASGYVDAGVRLIRTTDLATGSLGPDGDGIFVPEEAVTAQDRLEPGDLLLSRSGTIGRAFLAPEETAGMAFAGFLVRFRPGPEVIGRYLYYCTQSAEFQSAVQRDALSSTIQNFNAEKYNNLDIPLPSIAVQSAIADYLDRETARIDTLIQEQRRLIELLQERRKDVVSHAVLDETSERVQLRRLVDVIDCAHVTAEFVEDDRRFPVASIRECQGPTVDLSACNYTTAEFFDHLRAGGRRPRPGDLLFVRNVSVGLVSVVTADSPEFAIGQETVLLRRKSDVHPDFLRYALNGAEAQNAIEGAMIGSTFRRINVSAIRSLPVAVPPTSEQRRISAYLDEQTGKIDHLIAETEGFVRLCRERRSALITAAVTGQIDIREVA